MFMQEYSGLSTTQVNKMQFNLRTVATPLRSTFPLRPIAMLSAGLGVLSDVLFDRVWLGLALTALLVIGGYAVHAAFCRWLTNFNGNRQVLVVRDGLVRGTTLAGLVAGDIVKIPAGTLLATDVATTASATPSRWLQVILTLTGKTMPQGVALAGSRVNEDVQARVLAVGDQRYIAKMANDIFAVKSALPVAAIFQALLTGIKCSLIRLGRVLGASKLIQQVEIKVKQVHDDLASIPQVAGRASLVKSDVSAVKATAFRYNQDPVTSPRPSI